MYKHDINMIKTSIKTHSDLWSGYYKRNMYVNTFCLQLKRTYYTQNDSSHLKDTKKKKNIIDTQFTYFK